MAVLLAMPTARNRPGDTVNREYFMCYFALNNFQTNNPVPALSLISHNVMTLYFRAFNFCISQAVRKYFNFAIYGIMQNQIIA